jgi:four helix bundle protein
MFFYKDLLVYQKAFALNKCIYKLLKSTSAIPPYAKNQLGRSIMSVMLNIAEGYAKPSQKDKRNFLVIARASAFESEALIQFLASENDLPSDIASYCSKELEEISKMLFAMIKKLEQK